MTGFQSTVNIEQAFGYVGELFDDSPRISTPWALNTSDPTKNVIGSAFTLNTASPSDSSGSGYAQAGGTGVFVGILMNPKVYASPGSSSDPLAPTYTLPNYTIAELLTMGTINIAVPAACNVGDFVTFNQSTGVLGTLSPTTVGTATQSTTTLTVVTPASGNLGVGSTVNITGAEPVRILALGTGTGGAGTYTVDVSQTVSSSAAFTANSVLPSGFSFVPGGKIVRFSPGQAGLAVAQIG